MNTVSLAGDSHIPNKERIRRNVKAVQRFEFSISSFGTLLYALKNAHSDVENQSTHSTSVTLPELSPPARSEKVLIVDDEPIIRDILSKVVSSEGYLWGPASDGKEAIDYLMNSDYQIVIADVRMPSVNGLELLRYVISNHPGVAVIMITTLSNASSAVEASSIGAYDYVTKPFNTFELRNKIGRAAERRKLILEN